MTTDPTRAAEIVVEQRHETYAEEIVSAANIVSHDGYYEVDTDAVARVLARFERDHMQRPTDTARAVPQWRCVNCKIVIAGYLKPDRCYNCNWCTCFAEITPSPVTDETLADEVQRLIAIAYAAGCQAVHDNYQEDRDPDFSEAASDYARSIDLAALASTPQQVSAETVERYQCALRWIYENGMRKDRPDFVSEAISDAYEPIRAIRQSAKGGE